MIRQHCQLMDMNLSKLRETVKDREAWRATVYGLQRVRHNLATEQQHIRAFPFSNSPFGVEQSEVTSSSFLHISGQTQLHR